MTVFHADLAARSVPRYTSYPTAAEFGTSVGPADFADALATLRTDDAVSLYVHVPYCHEICWYCGCNTGAVGRASRLGQYVDALVAEMALIGRRTRAHVTRVHFGGGSPNALPPHLFSHVAAAIRGNFNVDLDAEWAAELDPRHLDPGFCRVLARIGVSRASIGAQTFDLRVQAKINRLQPFRMVAQSVAALREAGVRHLNLDLMYGLPGQTLDSIARTITLARALAPDRVAMFGYAHLPHMLSRQRMIADAELPDAEARFWQSMLARDLWCEAGYQPIGFDHYALPDDSLALAANSGGLRRNFQGFADDDAVAVIGLGASSISSFPDLLVQSEKHVGRYRMKVSNGQLATVRGIARSEDDRRRGRAIEHLLCEGWVDLVALGWSRPAANRAMIDAVPVLQPLADRGLLRCHPTGLAMTPDGAPYARLAAAAFDRFRAAPAGRFSAAV